MKTHYPHKILLMNFIKVLFFLTLLFLFFTLFQGCAAKPIENKHTIERIVDRKTDTVKLIEINQAIDDVLIVKVAKVKTAKPECDSITQATLDQVLKQLNTSKKSGYNEAKLYYDSILKQIVVGIKVGKTENNSLTIKAATTIQEKEKQVVPIRVKYVPFWAKFLSLWGGISFCYVVYKISRNYWII